MKAMYEQDGLAVCCGDCLELMPRMVGCTFDTIITDPPYGLEFMGKDWDRGVPGVPFWRATLRVAKPGAFLLCFGGTRTFHRVTCAIEDAGWEIRDCLMWLYGSGFPKSHDVSKAIDRAAGAERKVVGRHPHPAANKAGGNSLNMSVVGMPKTADITAPATEAARQWNGWGTALKPAWEPIIVAMKPLDGTFADNALRHGVAGLNVDGTRIGKGAGGERTGEPTAEKRYTDKGATNIAATPGPRGGDARGRWPANVILDEEAAKLLDEQTGIGSVSRFFYCAKVSKRERNAGLSKGMVNDHPTVKPLTLLEYLCKLTTTPTGGIMLDPFMGSGSTLLAARNVGREATGIEIDQHYCDIAVSRIKGPPPEGGKGN